MTATKISESRGRPRSFDMDDAIHKAMRLFHRRGYDAVGVAELGAELGIKPPSFYAAFGSKAGLFARAVEHYTAGDANVFGRAQAKGGSVIEVMQRMLLEAAEIYPEHDGVAGCLVLDGARNSSDAEARTLIASYKQASRNAVCAFIATEYPAKADTLSDLVIIALEGMSGSARDGAGAAALRSFAEAVGRAFAREAAGN